MATLRSCASGQCPRKRVSAMAGLGDHSQASRRGTRFFVIKDKICRIFTARCAPRHGWNGIFHFCFFRLNIKIQSKGCEDRFECIVVGIDECNCDPEVTFYQASGPEEFIQTAILLSAPEQGTKH